MSIGPALSALKSDAEITPEEITEEKLTELRNEIADCTPEQSAECISILEEAIPRALGDARVGLQGLRDTIGVDNNVVAPDLSESDEIQPAGNYSMEYLRENSNGFLSKLLEIEIVPGIDAMKAFMLTQGTEHIGSELLSIMPEAARENLQILTWNKIVNSLGVSSIFKHGTSSFFSGFSGILGGDDTGNSEDTETGLSIDSFSEIADSIQNFNSGNTDQNGTLQIPQELAILNGGSTDIAVPSGIAMGFDYLESLSIGYFTNMKALLELAKEQGVETSENFKNLLAHPQILQTILETGVYSENGMNINLENKSLILGNISQESIETAGQQVMQEIIGDTNILSGKIDGILAKTDKFVAIFEKLGIDPAVIKETLFNLPIIGFIFKILFGDFLDTIESRMSALNEAPEVVQAMENLGKYIENPENKDKLPFELNEENPGNISGDETDILKGFVKKIKNAAPGEGDEKDARIKDTLENPRLARQLFIGEGILEGDIFLQKIHNGVIALFGGSVKPTQAQFFEKLKSININALLIEDDTTTTPEDEYIPISVDDPNFIGPIQADVSETSGVDEDFIGPMQPGIPSTQDSAPTTADEVISEILSLEEQIQGITGFPATILGEDGTEKSIDYNSADKTIKIGEDSFTITEINQGSIPALGNIVTLGNLTFENNVGNLELGVTDFGKNFIKEAKRDGNIMNISVEGDDIRLIISGLIQNGNYTLVIPSEDEQGVITNITVVIQ